MRWLSAARDVAHLLRNDVLLPLKPGSTTSAYEDVNSAACLPLWHCQFQDCAANSTSIHEKQNHEEGMWKHVWREHRKVLMDVIDKYELYHSPSEAQRRQIAPSTRAPRTP